MVGPYLSSYEIQGAEIGMDGVGRVSSRRCCRIVNQYIYDCVFMIVGSMFRGWLAFLSFFSVWKRVSKGRFLEV